MRGRPRKPSAIRTLEGNRSRTDIPPDMPLQGFPECPERLTGAAAEHFRLIAGEYGSIGVLKRADTPAVEKLAVLWGLFRASAEAEEVDVDDVCKLAAAWDRAASKLGIQVIDRTKMMGSVGQKKEDPLRTKFLRIAK